MHAAHLACVKAETVAQQQQRPQVPPRVLVAATTRARSEREITRVALALVATRGHPTHTPRRATLRDAARASRCRASAHAREILRVKSRARFNARVFTRMCACDVAARWQLLAAGNAWDHNTFIRARASSRSPTHGHGADIIPA